MSADTTASSADAPVGSGTTERRQVPGVYRRSIGATTVTAISDGYATFPLFVVPDAKPDEADAMAREAFVAPGDLQATVNTYLIQTPTRTILFDTGFGGAAPGTGRIWQNLRAAGVEPGAIDTLVLSHGHPDHTAGLLAKGGTAAFPNAEFLIHANELRYWSDDANKGKALEFIQPWFDDFRAAVAPYKDRTTPIERDGQEIAPGVRVVELPGHTPGHVGLHIADGDAEHLIWTDLVHFSHLQFRKPEWGVVFDVDADAARRTRLATLDRVAADRLSVSGMHLPFPGFGYVHRDGGAYRFEPARWQHDL